MGGKKKRRKSIISPPRESIANILVLPSKLVPAYMSFEGVFSWTAFKQTDFTFIPSGRKSVPLRSYYWHTSQRHDD